jgi:hypothetical protein
MEICGEYFGFHQDEDIYDYLRAHYAHFFPLLRLQAGAAYLPGGMIIHYPLLPARSLLGAGLPHQQAAAGVPTAPPCLPCRYYPNLINCPTAVSHRRFL